MKCIKTLMVMPMCIPVEKTLELSIDSFNKAVSIGTDEELKAFAKRIGKRVYIFYAPNAMWAGIEANRKIGNEIIAGMFYVVAVDERGYPTSLTDKQIQKYMALYHEPEYYSFSDLLDNWSERLQNEFEGLNV